MKITQVNATPLSRYLEVHPIASSASIAATSYASRALKAAPPAQAAVDQVELSDSAKYFSNLVRKAKDMYERDQSLYAVRVQAISMQIRSGTYKVDPKAVADKMLMME